MFKYVSEISLPSHKMTENENESMKLKIAGKLSLDVVGKTFSKNVYHIYHMSLCQWQERTEKSIVGSNFRLTD